MKRVRFAQRAMKAGGLSLMGKQLKLTSAFFVTNGENSK
tara:strand:+ start:1263 stop:1379 length:117 start_codon:yes stop_codon:yes gene_type:complete